MKLRVVSFNVRGFRDGADRVAGVVRALAPDVLLLQETGSRRALRRLAADTRFRVARDPRTPLRRRVKNAVLVADPLRVDSIRLVRFARSARWYPRGALVARIHGGRGPFWAISVHLGLDGGERGRQAREIVTLVEALGEAAVVGGDLNATPDRRSSAFLASALRDCWTEAGVGDGPTFPAGAPVSRIDYVFVHGPLEVESAGVGAPGAATASDHLPVVVDLAVG